MTVDTIRSICRRLPEVSEDVKWGHDLCFCVAGKMFTVVSLERPHSIAFKCTPETFGDLVERPGIIPAPYMARNMWVQEQELGEALEPRALEALIKTAYELVVAKLPKSKQPGTAKPAGHAARRRTKAPRTVTTKRRGGPRHRSR